MPESHFKSFLSSSTDTEEQHKNWMEEIRQHIWVRITYEAEMVPTTEALWRHWQRSCWVNHYVEAGRQKHNGTGRYHKLWKESD